MKFLNFFKNKQNKNKSLKCKYCTALIFYEDTKEGADKLMDHMFFEHIDIHYKKIGKKLYLT